MASLAKSLLLLPCVLCAFISSCSEDSGPSAGNWDIKAESLSPGEGHRPADKFTRKIVLRSTEGHQNEITFEWDSKVELTLELEKGPPVDLFFADEANFAKLEESFDNPDLTVDYKLIDELSLPGFSGKRKLSAQLPAGTYGLLIENTDFGETAPPANVSNDTAIIGLIIDVIPE